MYLIVHVHVHVHCTSYEYDPIQDRCGQSAQGAYLLWSSADGIISPQKGLSVKHRAQFPKPHVYQLCRCACMHTVREDNTDQGRRGSVHYASTMLNTQWLRNYTAIRDTAGLPCLSPPPPHGDHSHACPQIRASHSSVLHVHVYEPCTCTTHLQVHIVSMNSPSS